MLEFFRCISSTFVEILTPVASLSFPTGVPQTVMGV